MRVYTKKIATLNQNYFTNLIKPKNRELFEPKNIEILNKKGVVI